MKRTLLLGLLAVSTVATAADSATELSTLPAAAQSSISTALGKDLNQYHARPSANGFEASNSQGALTAKFTHDGVQLTHDSLHWSMSLRAYGYGDALKPVAPSSPQASANRVEYRRGPLTEWYENGPVGLEQGFTLTAPPAKRDGQLLTIALSLSGDLTAKRDESRTGLTLIDRRGKSVLRYAGLAARDADGRDLRASLEVQGSELLIRVDDTNAHYPLVVDPLIELAKLTSSDGAAGDDFGWSVAINGDTIVVGAMQKGDDQQGAAYVFVKPPSGWQSMTQTAKLLASDNPQDGLFGWSVAVDGDTIAVTARNLATTYVFVKPAQGWIDMTQTAELFPLPAAYPYAYSVAVQGNTVVVGVVNGDAQGAAYVFIEPAGGWAGSLQPTATLTSTDIDTESQFGDSVAISGGTIVVGDSGADQDFGAAYVFVKPSTGWMNMTQTAKLTPSDGSSLDTFGASVAIAQRTVIVGAPKFSLPGAAYIFVQPSSGWSDMTESAELLSTSQVEDQFGYFVAINGNTAIVSAAFAKPQPTGYVFVKPEAGWKTTFKYNARFTNPRALRYCVSISGSTIVAGSVAASNAPGAAFVFSQ